MSRSRRAGVYRTVQVSTDQGEGRALASLETVTSHPPHAPGVRCITAGRGGDRTPPHALTPGGVPPTSRYVGGRGVVCGCSNSGRGRSIRPNTPGNRRYNPHTPTNRGCEA